MSGELRGSAEGSPVRVNADTHGITLYVRPSLRAARAMRIARRALFRTGRTRLNIPVRAKIGPFTVGSAVL